MGFEVAGGAVLAFVAGFFAGASRAAGVFGLDAFGLGFAGICMPGMFMPGIEWSIAWALAEAA